MDRKNGSELPFSQRRQRMVTQPVHIGNLPSHTGRETARHIAQLCNRKEFPIISPGRSAILYPIRGFDPGDPSIVLRAHAAHGNGFTAWRKTQRECVPCSGTGRPHCPVSRSVVRIGISAKQRNGLAFRVYRFPPRWNFSGGPCSAATCRND